MTGVQTCALPISQGGSRDAAGTQDAFGSLPTSAGEHRRGPGLGWCLLTHLLFPVPIMAPFCPQRHERRAQHRYQQQQRRRREEEERQRHAEHHARRERDASGREEARAEGPGLDPAAPEKASAKAKGSGAAGGHGPERPKRPGSLLAPNNVMKLKQIIPLQGKFLSSGAASSLAGAGANLTARPPPAPSPTSSDTRLPAFLSFKFLKSPETRRDPERSHSPPKAFHAGKLFPFGGARAEAGPNGAGGQARQDGTPGGGSGGSRAQRSGPADGVGVGGIRGVVGGMEGLFVHLGSGR